MGKSKQKYIPGKVVWFNDDKGYGFVEDTSGNLIFAHYSAIISPNKTRKTLEKNQAVEIQFTEELGEFRATKIKGLGESA